MSATAHSELARCLQLSRQLRTAARAGDLEAVASVLEERGRVLRMLERLPAGLLPAGELAEIARADADARQALEERRAALGGELEALRSGREAVARARRDRTPRLLSRRV